MPTHIFTDEEKEALREQMLEAGFPLLKQYGMTHTSVAKITQAAGIAVGTFYSFWKNKEAYMADLIGYHRRKLMPVLIGEDALTGKKKLGREDARRYLYAVIDEEISIYPHMTLEDEAKLFSGTKAFVPDLEKESAITAGLFLKKFAEGRPWLHLDIAGTADNGGIVWQHQVPGATGTAVSTLYQLAQVLFETKEENA